MGKEIRTIYKEGQDRLAAGGVHDAAFDARALLSFVLGIPFREIPLHYVDEASDEQQKDFDELIKRRLKGEPLQYITGEQEFMGLTFHVDPRVLIPRLDTEILAEQAVKYVEKYVNRIGQSDAGTNAVRVLDLCCGSGAIGLSIVALANTETDAARVEVVLSDISKDALEVAQQNAEQLGVFDRVTFIQSDLFDELDGQGGFDLIVSNPPYIRSDVIPTLDVEVRGHEPMLALDGGADGLDIYRRIAEDAPNFLKPGGRIMLEIGSDQGETVAALFGKKSSQCNSTEQDEAVAALSGHGPLQGEDAEEQGQPVFDDVIVMKDLAGLDRVVSARMK